MSKDINAAQQGHLHSTDPHFAGFLEAHATLRAEMTCFSARNFLLDEGIALHRAQSYAQHTSGRAPIEADAWTGAHREYLQEAVFLQRPGNGPPATVNPKNASRCPETFRSASSFVRYGRIDRKLALLRVINAHAMAARTGRSVEELITSSREVVSAHSEGRPADALAEHSLASILNTWNSLCDLRPCFATFMLDHEDILAARPEHDTAGWADEFRDRLGLSHLDPANGTRYVLLFRYPVEDVPKHSDLRKFERPLAIPTVFDGDLNPAFCPAPTSASSEHGHTVHLSGGSSTPTREIVHPYMDFDPKHLFRVGELRRPVPADLWPARRHHLTTLRSLYARDDYARRTDPEA